MTTQVSRDHHFVPQSYLAGFTDTGTKDGRLCVFDVVATKFFQAKPKRVAFEVDFNRVDIEGHPPDVLEQAFGKIESKCASVIRQICTNNQLPKSEELNYVLNLMALLAARNPAMRRSITIARQHEARVIGDLLTSDRRTYEHSFRDAREAGFISGVDVPFEKMREFVRKDDYRLEISPEVHLQTELAIVGRLLASLGLRYWSLLVAAPDAPDFVTCDHPINLAYKQSLFTIGARHALMGDRVNQQPPKIILREVGVAEVNGRILELVDRQLYSRTQEVVVLDAGEIVRLSLNQIGNF